MYYTPVFMTEGKTSRMYKLDERRKSTYVKDQQSTGKEQENSICENSSLWE
jgi:hypothetical protein